MQHEIRVLYSGPTVAEQAGGWLFLVSGLVPFLVINLAVIVNVVLIGLMFVLPFLALGAWFALRREGVFYNITQGEVVVWRNFLGWRSQETIPFDRLDRVSIGREFRSASKNRRRTVFTVSLSGPLPPAAHGDFTAKSPKLRNAQVGVHTDRGAAEQHGKDLAESLKLHFWLSPQL